MGALLRIKRDIRSVLDGAGKFNFVRTLPRNARLLDVGCGNRSASLYKTYRMDLEYVGIDVSDYHIDAMDKELMAEYRVCSPSRFAEEIRSFSDGFDAVISSHNLEHCDEPGSVLEAMCRVLRPGGRIHLSFPSSASMAFPSREGTLNFHDDPTHKHLISLEETVHQLASRGFRVERQVSRNRGSLGLMFLLGALQEPWSRRRREVLKFTWYFWGFESVVVARKP